MTSSDLPRWVWDLVIAVARYEDTHAKGAPCLDGVLTVIPSDVRAKAQAIAEYVGLAQQEARMARAEAAFGYLAESLGGLHGDEQS